MRDSFEANDNRGPSGYLVQELIPIASNKLKANEIDFVNFIESKVYGLKVDNVKLHSVSVRR